jgi:hypothetical protein
MLLSDTDRSHCHVRCRPRLIVRLAIRYRPKHRRPRRDVRPAAGRGLRPRLRKPEVIGNVRHLAERRCITPVAKPFCGALVKKIGLQLVARP